MKKNKFVLLLLILIFFLSYFLRVWQLKNNSLTFVYDQARDFMTVRDMIFGDFKIQGPPSSQEGLFHGVFYYYFLIPGYLLGKGNPVTIAYYVAFFNSLAVFLLYYISKIATKSKIAGLLSAVFFAVSFESSQYATWISNPTIAIWTVPIFYLGLWLWTSKLKKYAPIIAGVGLGLSIQAEIFLAYHIAPLLIWIFLNKNKIKRTDVYKFLISFVVSISSFIISEFKFGFNSLEAIRSLALIKEKSPIYAKSVGDYLVLYLNQIGKTIALNVYPGNIGYGAIPIIVIAIISLFKIKKDKYAGFLAIWIFSHIFVVSLGGNSTPFLTVGIGPAVNLILAYFVYKLHKKRNTVWVVLIILLVVYGNINSIFSENNKGSTLFAIQKGMVLSKQLQVVDYTYQSSGNEKFSINTLTCPLWINLVWTYLYDWYGEEKYGYSPNFHGRDQIGQLDGLDYIQNPLNKSFLIIEPMSGIPPQYLPLTVGEEDQKSSLLEEKYFGEIIVQQRELKNP